MSAPAKEADGELEWGSANESEQGIGGARGT